jgi:hypothetical protein
VGMHDARVDRDLPVQLVDRLRDHPHPGHQHREGAVA